MTAIPQTDLPQADQDQPELTTASGTARREEAEPLLEDQNSPLFPAQQCTSLEKEWQAIQAKFVDSPRSSVEEADALVRKTVDTLANSFAEMRGSLERTWERDKEVSTEELRLALQNYRSFFQRLLSI
jgi:hypothetical protein